MEYTVIYDIMTEPIRPLFFFAYYLFIAAPVIFVIGVGGTAFYNLRAKIADLKKLFVLMISIWVCLISLFTFSLLKDRTEKRNIVRQNLHKTIEGKLSVIRKNKSTKYIVTPVPDGEPVYFFSFPSRYYLSENDPVRVSYLGREIVKIETSRDIAGLPESDETKAILILSIIFFSFFGLLPLSTIVRMARSSQRAVEKIAGEQGKQEIYSELLGGWFNKFMKMGMPFQLSRPFVRLTVYDELLVIRYSYMRKWREDFLFSRRDILSIEPAKPEQTAKGINRAIARVFSGFSGARGISIEHTLPDRSNPIILWPADQQKVLVLLQEWKEKIQPAEQQPQAARGVKRKATKKN